MKSRYYVGTYTQDILFGTGDVLKGKGKGIYYLELDHETGLLDCKTCFFAEALPISNPSYLCLSPDKQTLYSVNELKEFNKTQGGAVTSIALTKSTDGIPAFSNVRTVPTYGEDPCYVSMEHTSSFLFAANYSGGSISINSIDPGGMIGTYNQLIPFLGKSINEDRQTCSHLHSVVCSGDNSMIAAADLGADKLLIYILETDIQSKEPKSELLKVFQSIDTPAGSGPRHSMFHPQLNYLYTTLELSSQIMVNALEPTGAWHTIQFIDSYFKTETPDNKDNLCADIQISSNGKFLYCSNRGRNCISAFRISQSDGRLTHIQDLDSHGLIPRSFCLDALGDFLLAANQNSDNIAVFRIEKDTGLLTYVSQYHIPTPVCIISE